MNILSIKDIRALISTSKTLPYYALASADFG